MKYKNKDGIELNYTGNDSLSKLTKEVVLEAVRILEDYNPNSMRSRDESRHDCIKFLRTNFDLGDKNGQK
tara:strand:- start:637 stop:846 length:210 start_codon:yes stop_codon:yes gene_type:complete